MMEFLGAVAGIILGLVVASLTFIGYIFWIFVRNNRHD